MRTDSENKDKIAKAVNEAEVMAAIYAAAKTGLQLQYMRTVECRLCLEEGEIIECRFQTGWERCIYEGIRSTGWCAWVNLRHFTKKGKPYKTQSRYEWDVTGRIRKPQEHP
jgi:hypothetical protein